MLEMFWGTTPINQFVKLAREIISLYGNSLFSFEQYDNYIHVTARRARYKYTYL